MTKNEIFVTIVNTVAEVCCVRYDEIMSSCKRESVVDARSISVFWLSKAGFSTDDILDMTGRGNAECINKIKRRFDEKWDVNFVIRECTIEAGRRLQIIADEINHKFDPNVPIRRMFELRMLRLETLRGKH